MFEISQLQEEVRALNMLYLFDHAAHRRTYCIYCNRKFIKDHPERRRTRDHVIPRKRLKHASNRFRGHFFQFITVACCFKCNNLKGDMSLGQFKDWLKERRVKNRVLIMQGIKRMMC